jgi:hypothetical protein
MMVENGKLNINVASGIRLQIGKAELWDVAGRRTSSRLDGGAIQSSTRFSNMVRTKVFAHKSLLQTWMVSQLILPGDFR